MKKFKLFHFSILNLTCLSSDWMTFYKKLLLSLSEDWFIKFVVSIMAGSGGGSSNPNSAPKILLAKPGLVTAGKFSRGGGSGGADEDAAALRSRLLSVGSLNLLPDSWDFQIDRFLPVCTLAARCSRKFVFLIPADFIQFTEIGNLLHCSFWRITLSLWWWVWLGHQGWENQQFWMKFMGLILHLPVCMPSILLPKIQILLN